MRIAVAADHAGLPLKEVVIAHLSGQGHRVIDLGTDSLEPVDYPDYARLVGEALQRGEADRGIVICGSGVGASIAANKMRGVRAAVCHDTYSARQGVEHDDMNVLCLGSRVVGPDLAIELVQAFVQARFSGEERYRRRLEKVLALEEAASRCQQEARTP
ncbi:MAG TPA: ribose 5-phosphate isomerase B [Dehalococcoidia bacterium]|nr:ribose 5-phosphate isomerase B [Dehalococcoidia bacterium]